MSSQWKHCTGLMSPTTKENHGPLPRFSYWSKESLGFLRKEPCSATTSVFNVLQILSKGPMAIDHGNHVLGNREYIPGFSKDQKYPYDLAQYTGEWMEANCKWSPGSGSSHSGSCSFPETVAGDRSCQLSFTPTSHQLLNWNWIFLIHYLKLLCNTCYKEYI